MQSDNDDSDDEGRVVGIQEVKESGDSFAASVNTDNISDEAIPTVVGGEGQGGGGGGGREVLLIRASRHSVD